MPNKNSFLRFTKSETSIYSTAKKELEKVIQGHNGEIIRITSFMKLPDVLYDISDNKLYVSMLLGFEQVLKIILRDILLEVSINPFQKP